jgi:hypothetical protein
LVIWNWAFSSASQFHRRQTKPLREPPDGPFKLDVTEQRFISLPFPPAYRFAPDKFESYRFCFISATLISGCFCSRARRIVLIYLME